MSRSAPAKLVDEDTIFRVETIPPPSGEDVHDCATKLGDWALALEEKRLAATAAQPTAKVNAFDLASALAKATPKRSVPAAAPAPPPALEASPEMDEPSASEDEGEWRWLEQGGFPAGAVDVVTIDVPEEAPTAAGVAATIARRPAAPRAKASRLTVVGVIVLEVLVAMAVLVVSALMLRR